MPANLKSILLTGLVHAPFVLLLTATLHTPTHTAAVQDHLTTFDVSTADTPDQSQASAPSEMPADAMPTSVAEWVQKADLLEQVKPVIQLAQSNPLPVVRSISSPAVANESSVSLVSAVAPESGQGAQVAVVAGDKGADSSANAPSARSGATGRMGEKSHDGYQDSVQRWIERHKAFPRHLSSKGISGTVVVCFELDRRGNIFAARIVKSSGHRELDQLATQQLAMAAPYPRPSRDSHWHRRSFNVPMIYRTMG